MHTLHKYKRTYVMKAHKNFIPIYVLVSTYRNTYDTHLPIQTPHSPPPHTHKFTLAYFPVSIITRMVTERINEWISDKLT